MTSAEFRAQAGAPLAVAPPQSRVVFGGVRRTESTVGAILRFEHTATGGASYVVALIAPDSSGKPSVVDFEFPESGRTLADALAANIADFLPRPGDPSAEARVQARREIGAVMFLSRPTSMIELYERKNYAPLQIIKRRFKVNSNCETRSRWSLTDRRCWNGS